MTDRRMEKNVKIKLDQWEFRRKLILVQTMIDQKQLENVKYFNYLSSLITNDSRSISEIKSSISAPK